MPSKTKANIFIAPILHIYFWAASVLDLWDVSLWTAFYMYFWCLCCFKYLFTAPPTECNCPVTVRERPEPRSGDDWIYGNTFVAIGIFIFIQTCGHVLSDTSKWLADYRQRNLMPLPRGQITPVTFEMEKVFSIIDAYFSEREKEGKFWFTLSVVWFLVSYIRLS